MDQFEDTDGGRRRFPESLGHARGDAPDSPDLEKLIDNRVREAVHVDSTIDRSLLIANMVDSLAKGQRSDVRTVIGRLVVSSVARLTVPPPGETTRLLWNFKFGNGATSALFERMRPRLRPPARYKLSRMPLLEKQGDMQTTMLVNDALLSVYNSRNKARKNGDEQSWTDVEHLFNDLCGRMSHTIKDLMKHLRTKKQNRGIAPESLTDHVDSIGVQADTIVDELRWKRALQKLSQRNPYQALVITLWSKRMKIKEIAAEQRLSVSTVKALTRDAITYLQILEFGEQALQQLSQRDPRQGLVITLALKGKTRKHIAAELGVSVSTVKALEEDAMRYVQIVKLAGEQAVQKLSQRDPRQGLVITLSLKGKTRKQIAAELGISVSTVKALEKDAIRYLRTLRR